MALQSVWRGLLTTMGTPDEATDGAGPAASAEPFMRSDDAAGSTYELVKLCVLGLTLAPLRLVLWVGLVLPMYGVCRVVCESRLHEYLLASVPGLSVAFAMGVRMGADGLGLPLSWVRAIGRAMARLTLVLLGFWPCCGIRRSGLNGRSPSQWAAGAVLIVCNHVSWLDILVSDALHPRRPVQLFWAS